MLIDNKNSYQNGQERTLIEFLKKKLPIAEPIQTDQKYEFDLVSGYYSIQALAELLPYLKNFSSLKLLLGHITDAEKDRNHDTFTIKNESLSIRESLKFIENIGQVLEFLQADKVQIKSKQPDFCHAKMYICDTKNVNTSFAVSGSSNFTPSGLGMIPSSNIELNQVFQAGSANIDELKNWFEIVYANASDNKTAVIEEIKNIFKTAYLPAEIYDKIIYHLFQSEFEASKDIFDQIQNNKNLNESVVWNKLFDFQKKGVVGIVQRLEKYNFALLGDGVGLGKTWQTLAVIKYYLSKGGKILVISPKKLEQNWKKYQHFHTDDSAIFYEDELNFTFKPMSQLTNEHDQKNNQKFDNFDLVVIDESHNLRNDKTESYKYLVEKILQGRKASKVLLLSATPLNNKVTDVRNQFNLGFQHEQNTFNSHFDFDLEGSFRRLQEILNKAQKDKSSNQETILSVTKSTKFLELVNSLCVARTRSVISKFYPDSQIKFPKAKITWEPLEIFEKAVEILMDRDKSRINFTIYKISKYLSAEKRDEFKQGNILEDEENREGFLSKMLMINLIKRLESSVYAFDQTLSRIIQYHDYILKLDKFYGDSKDKIKTFDSSELFEEFAGSTSSPLDFETEDVDLAGLFEDMSGFGKNIKDQLKTLQNNPDLIQDGYFIGGKKQVNIKDLGNKRSIYIQNVKREKTKLIDIQTQMRQEYGFDDLDMKIVKLKQTIKSKLEQNPTQKILIFTTYADTANYIYKNISKLDFIASEKIAKVTGTNSNIDQALKRFSPESMLYNELNNQEKQKYANFEEFWSAYTGIEKTDPIQILIGTDCISEGQNLQDCDFLINFDIHWNPVRLVQRNGRIDRIGSKFDVVNIKNFLPGKSLEDVLKIKSRLDYKMALVGLVGGVDTKDTVDEKTQEILDFWQDQAANRNQDLSQFSEAEVDEITINLDQPEKYKTIFRQITSNTLADYRELEMLKLMETNYDLLEDNELGFKSFSLDQYQVELAQILEHRSGLKQYPNGIYSGISGEADGVILLLKNKTQLKDKDLQNYKKSNAKHPYLMYQLDLEGNIIKRYTELPQILEYLKTIKTQDRFISQANIPSQNLEKYENIIKIAIKNYKVDFEAKEVTDMLSGGILNSKKAFSMDDFELITWLIVSKK